MEGQWRNVVLVLEVYALPKEDALAILESERGSAARYQRVLDLATTKKARLEILTALTTKSGQKAITEARDEVRYATEFAPGSAKGAAPVATTIETRNVGDTLEFEPIIGPDGHTCELSLVPQRVSLSGFRDLAGAPGDPTVAQPLFVMQRLVTSTTLDAGAPHYPGTLSRPGENGVAGGAAAEISLAFLRIHLHGPTTGEVKPPEKPFDWSAMNLEYSVYSLERAQAREILIAMPTLEAPWKKLQGLLQEKRARFEHLVAIKCKSGQKAVTTADHELRYATEYAPPGRTRSTEMTRRTAVTQPAMAEHRMAAKNPPDASGVNDRADDGRTWLLFVRALPNEP